MAIKLKFYKAKPYFSTLMRRYYSDYTVAFRESLRHGGGAYNDFNLFYVRPDETVEMVF
jgi:hypothetical protein